MTAKTAPPMHRQWRPADTLAARLVLVRRELGLSQREAAAATGLTFGQWQSMESGAQARGLDTKITQISTALGVDREWLMWGGPLGDRMPPDRGAEITCSRPGRSLLAVPPTRSGLFTWADAMDAALCDALLTPAA